jgi:hypothetical protein
MPTLISGSTGVNKITDGTVVNADMADDAIGVAELSASGTASSSTFLRGDNSWAEAGGGKLLQVVNVIDTSSPTSTTDSYADTGLTASITPSATSSKILVIVNSDGTVQSGDTSINYRCYRDSTEIGGTIIGRKVGDSNNSDGTPAFFGFTILDTPSSTSALTYKTQFANHNAAGTVRLNNGSGSSTMCLMEIGA